MKRLMLPLFFAMLLVLSGCGEPAPEPEPEPEAPPEPTQEEIYGQLRDAASPLFSTAQQPGGDVPASQKSQAITKLQSIKSRHTTSEHGPAALRQMQGDVEEIVTNMRDAQRWATVKSAVDFYKVFDPGSEKYLALVEKADLMLSRPKVTVKGFFELDDGLYAFLEVMDTQTRETDNYKVREGEELHDGLLRLVRIIGDRQSVEIEYTPINETWVVKSPKSSG